ncbi:MAG: electron transfer flavoprotein beta subunit/FixA family protein, partial [Moraxellaceae bacterium]|nr:electron transfer flavoprotein beta subunit/FixA family protein [Pseudobdellovibrionaceae bacterium]
LSIPHTTVVSKFESTAENITVERDVEGGAKEIVQMMTPALVAANKGLNMPRYASLPGIMKAKKKIIKEIEAAANTSQVKFSGFSFPADKAPVKLLTGDAAHQTQELIKLLRDEAKVL